MGKDPLADMPDQQAWRLTACVDSLDAIARGERPATPIDKFTKEEIEAATAMRDRMNNEPTAKKASKKLRGGTD